jgi:hypothetical protein
MLACTTVANLRDLIHKHILETGLTARTIFLHAQMPRFRQILIPERSREQLESRRVLADHLHQLSKVFGQINYAPGVLEYLQNWWQNRIIVVRNRSPMLADYYERKALHVNKMAMIFLFMEQHESLIIERKHVDRAISVLEDAERNMHLPLSGGGRNELYDVSLDVLEFIRAQPERKVAEIILVSHFLPQATSEELIEVFLGLENMGKVVRSIENQRTIYTATEQ